MNVQHLAIASVPMQSWGQTYQKELALEKGTIFQDLDMPFFAANCAEQTSCCKTSDGADPQQREREAALLEIIQTSFVVDDVRLYLDTHPQDIQALNLLKNGLAQRKQLLRDFAQRFYPLTLDCMADIAAVSGENCQSYCWQKGPLPWEGACV